MPAVHRVMAAAVEDLDPSERPHDLGGEPVQLTARDLVRAARLCIEHVGQVAGPRTRKEIERMRQSVDLLLQTPPGTADPTRFLTELAGAPTDVRHGRGAARVAAWACEAARCEVSSDGRGASEAAGQAARLTTKLLKKDPPALRAFLRALHRLLVDVTKPKAPPAVSRADLSMVYAAPLDDAARQVMADRLLELGDPRGELIALQYAQEAGHASDAAAQRVAQLLAQHRLAWLGPLAGVVRDATFARGFVDEVVMGNVPKQSVSAVVGAPEWSTVRTIGFEGRLAEPEAPTPLPVVAKLVGHAVMRSLVAVHGLNDVAISALATLTVAAQLEVVSLHLQGGAELDLVRAAVARMPKLRVLAMSHLPGQAHVWEQLDVERFEWVELTGAPLQTVFDVFERAQAVHLRGTPTWVSRTPDLLLHRIDGERRAWVNLGMTSVPRAEIMQQLETVDWSKWQHLTVYAKTTLGDEAKRLHRLTKRFGDRVTVTASGSGAPQVPHVLKARSFAWQRPSAMHALAGLS